MTFYSFCLLLSLLNYLITSTMEDSDYDSIEDEVSIAGRSLQTLKGQKVKEYPYNCIGMLAMRIQNQDRRLTGTASLISEDEIITVAHNIVVSLSKEDNKKDKESRLVKTKDLTFLVYDQLGHIEKYEIADYRFHHRFQQGFCFQDTITYDFALLKLKSRAVRKRFLTLAFNFDNSVTATNLQKEKEETAQVYGYQSPNCFSEAKITMEYCSSNQWIQKITKSKLIYLLTTLGGFSGGPIIYRDQAIGLHKGGISQKQKSQKGSEQTQKKKNVNFARLITSKYKEYDGDIVHHLYKWSLEMDEHNSDRIYAKKYKFAPEDVRKKTFWDVKQEEIIEIKENVVDKSYKQTLMLKYFTIADNVITKTSSKKGWTQLISKEAIDWYSSIYIKNIFIPKQAAICIGFISKSNKLRGSEQSFDGDQQNTIGIMITKNKQKKLQFTLRINKSVVRSWVLEEKADLIVKFSTLCKKDTEKKKKFKEKMLQIETGRKVTGNMLNGSNIFQDHLQNERYKFDFELDYYLFVNMMIPQASAYIEL